jgi:hypothetical protein
MTKSIARFFCFIAIFLIASYGFSFYTRVSSDKAMRKVKQDLAKELDLRTLIIGDSQAWRSIDPRFFDNAYNFASLGENSILSYYKAKYVIDNYPKLEDLIITINLHSFSDYKADKFPRSYQWREYLNFWEMGLIRRDLGLYIWKFFQAYFFAYEKHGRKILSKKAKSEDTVKVLERDYYKGYLAINTNHFTDVTDRVDKYFKNKNAYDESLITYYQKIFDLCQKKSIRVHLVRMPISKAFYEKAGDYIDYKDFDKLISRFQGNFNNLEYYDLSGLENITLDNFFDDLHLNIEGSKTISKYLSEELKKRQQHI